MINVRGIEKRFGTTAVLAGVSFVLGDRQRGALVGQNGTGKSTILKILAGILAPDAGMIDFGPHASVGYLPQDTSLAGDEPIIEYLRRVTGIADMEREMASFAAQPEDPEKKEKYDAALAAYERMNGYGFEARVDAMLAGFGMDSFALTTLLQDLSSGQKSKVAMIGLLLREDDVLLLDEPTNNLDLSSLIWLEAYLRKSTATILIVSHDRRFVDRIADKVIELDWNTRTVTMTNGTYSDYLVASAKRRARQLADFRSQQDEIARLTDRASQLRQRSAAGSKWKGTDNDKFLRGFKRDQAGKSGRGAKAIEQRIEQMDVIEKPVERIPLEIDIGEQLGEGNREISLRDICVGYLGGFVVGPVTLDIPFGMRIGIFGENGTGKSTLLKAMTGFVQPLSGDIRIGNGVRMGDMLQEHDTLPRNMTPIQFLTERAGIEKSSAYALLARFGVPAVQARENIDVLSPGGRARVLLGLFSALQKNVLVLDEPTNHLDLEAMEALEEAISGYRGTVIVVSHDRFFIEKARLETMYQMVDRQLKAIDDFEAYVKRSEDRAKRLMRNLPR
jgi:ATPase subunit of ABC transporter with duplicated ATPase domains